MKIFDLSICIATRNRCDYLKLTLDNILGQITDDVEVVVLDGASTDGTSSMLTALSDVVKNLKYIRMDSPGGIDHDFNLAVESASGRYAWLMSDDDTFLPGTIDRVLHAAKENHALIIVNSQVRNVTLSVVLEERRAKFHESRLYAADEHETLFANLGNYLSFIGGVIILREVWMQRDRQSYVGTMFVHAGVIFQAPLPGSAFFIADPLIVIRYGMATWTGRAFEIWMFKWPSLVWSFKHFNDKTKKMVFPQRPWRKPHRLFLYRAKGAYSTAEYASWIRPREENLLYGTLARLIAVFPGVIANLVMLFFCQVTYPRYAVAMVDLRNSRFYPFGRTAKATSGTTDARSSHSGTP